MYSVYKTHHKLLYSSLVELSRNIFFYKEIRLKDDFETRINDLSKTNKEEENSEENEVVIDTVISEEKTKSTCNVCF